MNDHDLWRSDFESWGSFDGVLFVYSEKTRRSLIIAGRRLAARVREGERKGGGKKEKEAIRVTRECEERREGGYRQKAK